jgi:AcrR family transcriptional regulator
MTIAMNRVANDSHEKFLSAGVSLIAKRGIDNITVADISRESGYTRATFYSYFGDLDGLYAEIWMLHGRSWLDDMAHNDVPYSSQEDKLKCDALLEIFISCKRRPSVLEVVLPGVATWWSESTEGNKSLQAKLAWLVAANIGVATSKHLAPAVGEVADIVSLIRSMPTNQDQLAEIGVAIEPSTKFVEANLETPVPTSGSDEDKIKISTIEVVAAAGVADASMTRIARNLQVSTGSVYPKFKNVNEVIGESFSWSIERIVSDNTAAYFATSGNTDSYASVIVGSLSESRKPWRNFRLEMYLASRVHESLSKKMAPGLEVSDAILAKFVIKNGISEKYVDKVVGLMHALGIGFAVLQNAGIDARSIEHRLPTRFLVSSLSKAAPPRISYQATETNAENKSNKPALGGRESIASVASR